MDRSLKWRTLFLVLGTLFFVLTLVPSFVPKTKLPPLFTKVFKSKMSLGLDLQGGLHLVYSIDLDKAIDDKASQIKTSLDTRFTDAKIKGAVKTPASPVGAVTVLIDNAKDVPTVKGWITEDDAKDITYLDCPKAEPPNTICFRVSSSFGDNLKKNALTNAVSTIRERIN